MIFYGADYVYDSSPAIQDLKPETIINKPLTFENRTDTTYCTWIVFEKHLDSQGKSEGN